MFARPFLAVVLLMANAASAVAASQSTTFTYQGQLQLNGQPANGTYPMAFALFDAQTSGNQVGSTTSTSVAVSDGAFSTQLTYPGAFAGTQLWLQITVNGQLLSGRQQITTAPVAQFSLNGATSLYYNADASTAATPPATTLATIGPITYTATCALSGSNTVSVSLKVSGTSAFDLSEIIGAQINTGTYSAGPAQGTGLGNAVIETASAASGNYVRAYVSPSILHAYSTPAITQSIHVYLFGDARTTGSTSRTCLIEGQVTSSYEQ